jgi:hypothetical protein
MLIKKMAPLVAALAVGGIAVVVAQAGTSHTTTLGLTTHVVTHHYSPPGGAVATVSGSVSCPSGSKVTGGGYDAPYGGNQKEVASRPHGNGWYAKVLSTGSITVYAVCANVS